MASLRRSKTLAADGQTTRFLYTILKQLDLKTVDWALVASTLDITNGHAARMRYSRFRQHMEGIPTQPRGSRGNGPAKEKEAKGTGKRNIEDLDQDEDNKIAVKNERTESIKPEGLKHEVDGGVAINAETESVNLDSDLESIVVKHWIKREDSTNKPVINVDSEEDFHHGDLAFPPPFVSAEPVDGNNLIFDPDAGTRSKKRKTNPPKSDIVVGPQPSISLPTTHPNPLAPTTEPTPIDKLLPIVGTQGTAALGSELTGRIATARGSHGPSVSYGENGGRSEVEWVAPTTRAGTRKASEKERVLPVGYRNISRA